MSLLVDLPPLKPEVLSTRVISRVDAQLAAKFGLTPEQTSIGIITATIDDALYVALDEGTKAAPAAVVYAKSFYAGSAHASGPLSGEVIGIYAAADPDIIHVALAACVRTLEQSAWFYAADAAGRLGFFPHVVAATGSYLSREAGIPLGSPLAYLIAPPAESLVGLDAALKAAPVELKKWFGPPSETNYGGGWLAGDLPSCQAAARAFAAAVVDVARHPRDARRDARAAGDSLGARPGGPAPAGKYRVLATGERLAAKPEHLTHLVDDESLVPKTHPRIVLRGKLDTLQGALLEAQVEANAAAAGTLVGELGELLELTRKAVGAEVTGRPLDAWKMLGLSPDAIRHVSHHTFEYYGVPFMYPSVRQGPVVARLYSARALAREAELAALTAFAAADPTAQPLRNDVVLLLNRLSNALYIMTCKFVSGRYDGDHRPTGPVKGWKPPASKPS